MNNDKQVKTVQEKIGRVQGQMKENIELVMQRQENLEVLADKSTSLQESATQFSQVASRIREDQQLQQYKFYAGILFGTVVVVIFVTWWSSPGKLIGSLIIVGVAALLIFYIIQMRKRNSIALADSVLNKSEPDIEKGRGSE